MEYCDISKIVIERSKKDDDIYLQKTKPKNIYVYYLNKKLRKNNVL